MNWIFERFFSILDELGATLAAAWLIYYLRNKIPFHWKALPIIWLSGFRSRFFRPRDSMLALRNLAISHIKLGQSLAGIHYGQFGKDSDLNEENKYQSGAENLNLKPRMYLTIWPSTILHKYKLLKTNVRIAKIGVNRLFTGNYIAISPTTGQNNPNRPNFVKSYRHTICACLMKALIDGWGSRELFVLDEMLDGSDGWQNPDGGWMQCDHEHTASDLWASAYAARFLYLALNSDGVPQNLRPSIERAVILTTKYFRDQWNISRWVYNQTSTEENLPYLTIELEEILQIYDNLLLTALLEQIGMWMTVDGNLKTSYVGNCNGVSLSSLTARISYAQFRSGLPIQTWSKTFERIREIKLDGLSSSEWAFVLDMANMMNNEATVT